MLHKSIVGKFTRAGVKIKQTNQRGRIKWYMATYQDKSVAWYEEEGRVRSLHSPSIYTDIVTDCSCDIYFEAIDHALYHLIGYEAWLKHKNKKKAANAIIDNR